MSRPVAHTRTRRWFDRSLANRGGNRVDESPVVAEVDRLGQRDNTLFIFLSDNGAPGQLNRMHVKADLELYPDVTLPGDNLPFRGKKCDVYEGGVRTPGLVCWPGRGAGAGSSHRR